ncbi:MAG: hypothetical protein LBH00_09010 [Planctomycetaceae bacterium]|nr:hypothetical protein [Planctomycetaceae bacterium]
MRICLFLMLLFSPPLFAQPLPGTDLLTATGNAAEENTRKITAFLNKKIAESEQHRGKYWNRNFDSTAAYEKSVEKNRERFKHIIGVRDKRKPFDAPELCGTLDVPALIAETETHQIYTIRWAVFETLHAEGLLLEPKSGERTLSVIAIPPAGITPEQFIGLDKRPDDLPPFILSAGQRGIVPVIVDRNKEKRSGKPHREFIYRSAFQLGRHIIGYEVQEILALVDWQKKDDMRKQRADKTIISVQGMGEGGLTAMYAAAVDTRIDQAVITGYFNNRNNVAEEPIDHNVFGLLDQFGDAEIASLIAPRDIIIADCPPAAELILNTENKSAPGKIVWPETESTLQEMKRAKNMLAPLQPEKGFCFAFVPAKEFREKPQMVFSFVSEKRPNPAERMQRIVDGMNRHTQDLLNRAELTRRAFWKPLDDIQDAESPEFAEKWEWYRNYFAKEQIGQFDDPLAAPKPRTRKKEETDKYTMYETELDVFDRQHGGGITVSGLLLIPKGMKEGEKRPVVVCQHGLEGTPEATLRGGAAPYSGFTTALCERGYITFAPQGIFTGGDKFRYNQRQLNVLGKTLFSIMVPQHQQLVNWLGTLPFVDKDKIAFYGLSYGGKTAMRVPPLVKNYCLSICSADFNAWNVKNASTVYPFSYVWSGEYEIFEFDLANTFDYSDMARLIAPRPFMVERGYHDGVGWDEFVAFEYAKVFDYYAYRLKKPERTAIHFFNGKHKINGEETYPWLDKMLLK